MLETLVRRPVFTWVLVLSVVVAGGASFLGLPVERMPNVDLPAVSITTLAPGLSPAQVETEVTSRIEAAVGTVGGLERLDSISQEGVSLVTAQFVLEKQGPVAAQDVRDRLARIASTLPGAARPPQVEQFNANAAPVLTLAIRASTLVEATELAEQVIRRELQSLDGVGDVRVFGGARRTVAVELDPARLLDRGVTALEVLQAVRGATADVPGAEVEQGERAQALRLRLRAASPEALGAVVVAWRSTHGVRLDEVARVQEVSELPRSLASHDGVEAVVLSVVKQSGANTLSVLTAVRSRLDELRGRLPVAASVEVVRDEGVFVEASLHAVEEHLVLGALFASLVVWLFLRSGRATLIAALSIPASVVGTFAAVKALGLSLNMLSLLGLTLAVGIVIDDAVVVLENVIRVLRASALSPREATLKATREISLAVLATTLSLVAVFAPVGFMGGIVGRFLASFGLTMTVSILLSLAVAFTLTPMLCARWLKAEPSNEPHVPFPPLADDRRTFQAWADGSRRLHGEHAGALERAYARLMGWVMLHRPAVGVAIAVALVAILPLLQVVPARFMPEEDEARFELYLRLPQGTRVEQTGLWADRVAQAVRASGEVQTTVMMAGPSSSDASRQPNEATLYVGLRRRGVQAAELARARALASGLLPEGSLVMGNAVGDFSLPGPDGAAVQLVVRGPELARLEALARGALEVARTIPGTTDHGITAWPAASEWGLSVSRTRAAELGVSTDELAQLVAMAGRRPLEVGVMKDPLDALDTSQAVTLGFRAWEGDPLELVRLLEVTTAAGPRSLAELTSRHPLQGESPIRRLNRERQVTVFLNTDEGVSDAAVVEQVRSGLVLPPGYSLDVVGNARELEKTASAFAMAIILSFLFMYLVLAAQFESWVHPFTILLSLPLSVPFALLSLLAGGQSLNLFSALGFLVLFGIVKKNSILQVDHMLALEREGVGRADAVVMANVHRLRPILMTTVAFVAGLLPLVLSGGAGAGTNRAIGIGVMGGQTLSLLLTLVATPVVFWWVEDVRRAALRWESLLPRGARLRWG